MAEFLLEIGCEEIPARMLSDAVSAMKNLLKERLEEVQLVFADLETHGTPRRLMACITGLADRQEAQTSLRRGPSVDKAFDPQGRPTRAALGFVKSARISLTDLQTMETSKGCYICSTIRKEGETAERIMTLLVPELLKKLPWPKSMRWGEGSFRFVRPVRSLLVLLDGRSLPISLADIAQRDSVRGHRFLAPDDHVVQSIQHYKEILINHKVMLDQTKRREKIVSGVTRLTEAFGGVALLDADLVEENSALTEWPTPVSGRFDPDFLKLPDEVLATSMKKHQKYFPVFNQENSLMPFFIAVSDREIDPPDSPDHEIVRGYERVLRARLSDAAFFWDEDRKQPLISHLDHLKGVLFQDRLGTLFEKTNRLCVIAPAVAEWIDPALATVTERAAHLSKCDLVTGMVGEFPSLQGVMGGYYARHDGEERCVADAVQEHYRPEGPADALPETVAGRCLALADKLDLLVGCFGIDRAPSGTRDPYGLRRAALGVLRIVRAGAGLRLPLRHLIQTTCRSYSPGMLSRHEMEITEALLTFFYGRFTTLLKEEGLDYGCIEAVRLLELDDFLDVGLRVHALALFKQSTACDALVAANKRIANMLAGVSDCTCGEPTTPPTVKVEKRDFHGKTIGVIHTDLLLESAEKELFRILQNIEKPVVEHVRQGSYQAALKNLAQMREPIDRFFDEVLVMTKDRTLRDNRLALLAEVRRLFCRVADINAL